MAVGDKLKERQEAKPQTPEDDDKLIIGLLVPVKFNYQGKKVKGYLNIHPDAVYLGRIGVALDVAFEEAGKQIELNVWEPNNQSGGGRDWKNNGGGGRDWRG